MAVKAKFWVSSVSDLAAGQGSPALNQKQVRMNAVYDSGEGNKEWSKWTPSGTLEMTITNPEAFSQFKPGQYVLLTLEPQE